MNPYLSATECECLDKCRRCGVELSDENWSGYVRKRHWKMCKLCHTVYVKTQYYARTLPHHGKCKICGVDLSEKNWWPCDRRKCLYVCSTCERQFDRDRYSARRESILVSASARYHHLKAEVFGHYGSKCERCGFADMRALSIDHILGRAKNHRHDQKAGEALYRWLKNKNYPDGYQTLCLNCQFIKRHEDRELFKK